MVDGWKNELSAELSSTSANKSDNRFGPADENLDCVRVKLM